MISITANDKFHWKCYCSHEKMVNCIRHFFWFSCALNIRAGHMIKERPKIKLHYKNKNINNNPIYLEHDEKNFVDFRGETTTFTFLMFKILFKKWI